MDHFAAQSLPTHKVQNLAPDLMQEWKQEAQRTFPVVGGNHEYVFSHSPPPGQLITLEDAGSILCEGSRSDASAHAYPRKFEDFWLPHLAKASELLDPKAPVIYGVSLDVRVASLAPGKTQVNNQWHIDIDTKDLFVGGHGLISLQRHLAYSALASDKLATQFIVPPPDNEEGIIRRFRMPEHLGQGIVRNIIFDNQDALTRYGAERGLTTSFGSNASVAYHGALAIHRGLNAPEGADTDRLLLNFGLRTIAQNGPAAPLAKEQLASRAPQNAARL